MKSVVYIILAIVLSTTLFSCGTSAKACEIKKNEEVTFTLREQQEIMHRKIVQKQRTIIAAAE